MNPFLRYLADKNSAHTHTDRQTHRQTDRHTPMTTRPCGLRRAGNKVYEISTYILFTVSRQRQRERERVDRRKV